MLAYADTFRPRDLIHVEYHLEVEDLETGQIRTYDNPLDHKAEAVHDIGAFACPN